jgi:hypothetical protein
MTSFITLSLSLLSIQQFENDIIEAWQKQIAASHNRAIGD